MIPTNEPQPLTTSRTGGRSARLIALGIVALLGTVIYVGASGQSKPTASPPAPVALASPPEATEPAPIPDLPTGNSPAKPGPGFHVVEGPADAPRSRVATIMSIAGQAVFAATNEVDVGKLQVSYVVPLPTSVPEATIDVVQVDELSSRADNYGTWSIDLGVFHGGVNEDSIIQSFAPTVLLALDRQPDSAPSPDAPDIARNGYHIQVTGKRDGIAEIVAVTLLVDRGTISATDQYEVSTQVGGHPVNAGLSNVEPGRIETQIVFPTSLRARHLTVVLRGTRLSSPSPARSELDTITIDLPSRTHYPAGEIAAHGGAPADPNGVTGLERTGYYFAIKYTLVDNRRAVQVIVSLVPIDASTVDSPPRRTITGDDGFVGWPTAATLPNPQ
jgi:hypothetical protein